MLLSNTAIEFVLSDKFSNQRKEDRKKLLHVRANMTVCLDLRSNSHAHSTTTALWMSMRLLDTKNVKLIRCLLFVIVGRRWPDRRSRVRWNSLRQQRRAIAGVCIHPCFDQNFQRVVLLDLRFFACLYRRLLGKLWDFCAKSGLRRTHTIWMGNSKNE